MSNSIKRLEKELGTELFLRQKQRLYLNENGKSFYQTTKQALQILDNSVEALKPILDKTITIALTSQSVYTDMFYAYEHQEYSVPIKSHVIRYEEVVGDNKLQDYNFYLGVIEDLNPNEREIVQLCSTEYPVVMISRSNPLAQKQVLRLEELQDMSFIFITQDNDSSTHFVERIFKEKKFKPQKIYEGNYLVRQKMVMENKAVAITTMVGAVANSLLEPDIVFIPLVGVSQTRTQCISWDKHKKLTLDEKRFIRFAQDYFEKHPWF